MNCYKCGSPILDDSPGRSACGADGTDALHLTCHMLGSMMRTGW